jgi:hypothetical protein
VLNLRACYNSRILRFLRYLLFHGFGRRHRRALTQAKPSLTTLLHGNGKPSSSEMVRRDAESHDPLKLLASLPCLRSFRGQVFFLYGLRIRQRLVYRSIFVRLGVNRRCGVRKYP